MAYLSAVKSMEGTDEKQFQPDPPANQHLTSQWRQRPPAQPTYANPPDQATFFGQLQQMLGHNTMPTSQIQGALPQDPVGMIQTPLNPTTQPQLRYSGLTTQPSLNNLSLQQRQQLIQLLQTNPNVTTQQVQMKMETGTQSNIPNQNISMSNLPNTVPTPMVDLLENTSLVAPRTAPIHVCLQTSKRVVCVHTFISLKEIGKKGYFENRHIRCLHE